MVAPVCVRPFHPEKFWSICLHTWQGPGHFFAILAAKCDGICFCHQRRASCPGQGFWFSINEGHIHKFQFTIRNSHENIWRFKMDWTTALIYVESLAPVAIVKIRWMTRGWTDVFNHANRCRVFCPSTMDHWNSDTRSLDNFYSYWVSWTRQLGQITCQMQADSKRRVWDLAFLFARSESMRWTCDNWYISKCIYTVYMLFIDSFFTYDCLAQMIDVSLGLTRFSTFQGFSRKLVKEIPRRSEHDMHRTILVRFPSGDDGSSGDGHCTGALWLTD